VTLTRWLAAVPVFAFVLVAAAARAVTPWSLSGWWILASVAAGGIGLVLRPSYVRRAVGILAGFMLLGVVIVRLVAARDGRSPARMITLPGGDSSRWVGRLLDEQDVSLAGTYVVSRWWRLPPGERSGLAPATRAAYVEMRDDLGTTPSPSLDTALGRQVPGAFDTIVVWREAGSRAEAAVVFLHGYGGSFTLECWLVARAADAIGAITACPATDRRGRWSDPEGEQTLRATLHYLHCRGVRRVYLAGLSNGALGASRLAPRFASSLAGLILISGAPSEGATAGLPALVVQGEHDPMASTPAARAFATRNHARYAGFDAGHFVLLTHRERARTAIGDWLREAEASRASSRR
jgi:pimeloyl-ACP methyl ester carboxylesterase